MVAWRLAALWLGLIAAAAVPQARGAGGEVVADRLAILDEPDDSGYASGELRRGERVSATSEARSGWLAIAPPRDSFDWVDASAIRVGPDGGGEVIAVRATVRSGCPDARLPGPPRPPLTRGDPVRVLDLPRLATGRGKSARTWLAIAPPAGEVRYVRAVGVKLDPSDDPDPSPRATPASRVDSHVRPARGPGDGDPALRFEEAIRRSRRRDDEFALARQRLADARADTERGYDARGLLQASSRKVEGQKVHALIGPEGVPIAYLAIPPRHPRRTPALPQGRRPGRGPLQRIPRRPAHHRPRPRPRRQAPMKPVLRAMSPGRRLPPHSGSRRIAHR